MKFIFFVIFEGLEGEGTTTLPPGGRYPLSVISKQLKSALYKMNFMVFQVRYPVMFFQVRCPVISVVLGRSSASRKKQAGGGLSRAPDRRRRGPLTGRCLLARLNGRRASVDYRRVRGREDAPDSKGGRRLWWGCGAKPLPLGEPRVLIQRVKTHTGLLLTRVTEKQTPYIKRIYSCVYSAKKSPRAYYPQK